MIAPAGSMSQTARGGSSSETSLDRARAGSAVRNERGDRLRRSVVPHDPMTVAQEAFAMFAPMRPRPTIPSCSGV